MAPDPSTLQSKTPNFSIIIQIVTHWRADKNNKAEENH